MILNIKFKRTLAIALFVVTMLSTGSALAENHDYAFAFTNVTTTRPTESFAKSDNDQNWYISLDYGDPSGMTNTLSSSNILGVRARKSTTTAASAYYTFSSYVSGYPMPYTTSVSTGTSIYMAAKKDNTSTSSATLFISGRWAP